MSTTIHNRIVACMRDVEAIGKNKKNQQQGFSYRGIDDVYNALNPILSKHGVFTAPEVVGIQRESVTNKNGTLLHYSIVTMKHKFYCEDGSMVETVVVGEGMDSGDKATNKAMAIAHKYALFQIFCIPTEDVVDPDAESHQTVAPVTQEQLARLKEIEAEPKTNERIKTALAYYKAKSVGELTKDQAATVIAKISGA